MADSERRRIDAETTALKLRVTLRLAVNVVGPATVAIAGDGLLPAPGTGQVCPFYRVAPTTLGLGQLAAPWVGETAAMAVGACPVRFV